MAIKCPFIDWRVQPWLVIHCACREITLFKRQKIKPSKKWISEVVTALHFLTLPLADIFPGPLEPSLVVQNLGSHSLPYINLRCFVFGLEPLNSTSTRTVIVGIKGSGVSREGHSTGKEWRPFLEFPSAFNLVLCPNLRESLVFYMSGRPSVL